MSVITEDKVLEQITYVDYYQFPGTTVTVCCVRLRNGFNVIGQSACVIPAEFNEQKGKDLAYRDAFDKIYQLEGYLLKESLYPNGRAMPF